MAGLATGRETLEAMFSSLSMEIYRNLDAKQAEIVRLTDLLKKAEESRQELVSERIKLEANTNRLKHAQSKAEDSRKEIDEARKEVKSQRDWLKLELERVRVESEGVKDESKRTKLELDMARQERDQAVKMLHQVQLENADWKRESEKSEADVSHLRREVSQSKDQAKHWQDLFLNAEEERRLLASKIELLRERDFDRKVKSEERPLVPLTPASSSRHAGDDSANSVSPPDSPIQHQKVHVSSAQKRAGTNTAHALKLPKTPKASTSSNKSSKVRSNKTAKDRYPQQLEEDQAEHNSASSPSPLVYPEPSPHPQDTAASVIPKRSVTRTRVIRRVNDHQFVIKREENQYHADVGKGKQREQREGYDEYEEEDDQLVEEDDPTEHSPENYVHNAINERVTHIPENRSQSAWLFEDGERERDGEQPGADLFTSTSVRAGPSSTLKAGGSTGRGRGRVGANGAAKSGRKISRSRSRLRRKIMDNRPNYAEDDYDYGVGDGDAEEEGDKVRKDDDDDDEGDEEDEEEGDQENEEEEWNASRNRRARSNSFASSASSADELMITGDVAGSSNVGALGNRTKAVTPYLPHTPHAHSSSKKRGHEPVMASLSETAKKRRKVAKLI